MTPSELITLAVMAFNIAAQIRALATSETEKDATLTPEQKAEFIRRIDAAQSQVIKIE